MPRPPPSGRRYPLFVGWIPAPSALSKEQCRSTAVRPMRSASPGTAGDSSIAGTLTLGGTGMLVVDGDLAADKIVQTGGAVTGRGRIASGDYSWNGGNQGGSGTTEVTAGGPGLSLAGEDGRSLG